jgi:hypothetical protein
MLCIGQKDNLGLLRLGNKLSGSISLERIKLSMHSVVPV